MALAVLVPQRPGHGATGGALFGAAGFGLFSNSMLSTVVSSTLIFTYAVAPISA